MESNRRMIRDQFSGPVDNRCCFCLNLRIGSAIVGLANALVISIVFVFYVTSPNVKSSLGYPGNPVTNLDISFLVAFAFNLICDAILIWGAIKKVPTHAVPWLWANAVVIAVFLVIVTLLMFFGYKRTSLNAHEYTSILAATGVFGALHLFSWLVVYQFRRNLIEEQLVMANIMASAPNPPTGELPTMRVERASTPPPKYEDVTKRESVDGRENPTGAKIGSKGSESPPEYDMAIAMCLQETNGLVANSNDKLITNEK